MAKCDKCGGMETFYIEQEPLEVEEKRCPECGRTLAWIGKKKKDYKKQYNNEWIVWSEKEGGYIRPGHG